MAITSSEAAEALRDIAQTDRLTRVSGSYHVASPHLILWGLVWAAGYTLSGLTPPERWGLVWLPLILVGVVGATALGMRRGASAGAGTPAVPLGKSLILALAIALFMGSVYFVFRPASALPYLVFPALITALVYVLIGGLSGLMRYVAIGAAIYVVTMAGYVWAQPWLPFWIAGAGGGGLILGGLWMRKV